MKAKNLESAVADLDQCLIAYIEQRRSHIEAFVAQHFSLRETFRIQKKSFLLDLLVNPINTAWSIPYLSIRKLTEAIEKLGWNNAADFLKLIPSGIKTHYQKEIERLVATELLDFQLQGNSGLIEKLKDQEAEPVARGPSQSIRRVQDFHDQ